MKSRSSNQKKCNKEVILNKIRSGPRFRLLDLHFVLDLCLIIRFCTRKSSKKLCWRHYDFWKWLWVIEGGDGSKYLDLGFNALTFDLVFSLDNENQ